MKDVKIVPNDTLRLLRRTEMYGPLVDQSIRDVMREANYQGDCKVDSSGSYVFSGVEDEVAFKLAQSVQKRQDNSFFVEISDLVDSQ
jgi:hypothetical protein